jgi:hypothetical protein
VFNCRFRNRWKDTLGFRLANNLNKQRAKCLTSKSVDDFFKLLADTVEKLGLSDKPQNIFNVDETCFSSEPSRAKVFAQKGASNVNRLTCNNEKLNYTVQVIF